MTITYVADSQRNKNWLSFKFRFILTSQEISHCFCVCYVSLICTSPYGHQRNSRRDLTHLPVRWPEPTKGAQRRTPVTIPIPLPLAA